MVGGRAGPEQSLALLAEAGVERLREQVAVGQIVGLGVVEQLVAGERTVALLDEDIRDTNRQRDQRDQEQDSPEAAPVVVHDASAAASEQQGAGQRAAARRRHADLGVARHLAVARPRPTAARTPRGGSRSRAAARPRAGRRAC